MQMSQADSSLAPTFFTSTSHTHTFRISRLIIFVRGVTLDLSLWMFIPITHQNFKPIRPSALKVLCILKKVKVEAIPVRVKRVVEKFFSLNPSTLFIAFVYVAYRI